MTSDHGWAVNDLLMINALKHMNPRDDKPLSRLKALTVLRSTDAARSTRIILSQIPEPEFILPFDIRCIMRSKYLIILDMLRDTQP